MIFRFKPSPSRMASIWIGEVPNVAYELESSIDRRLQAGTMPLRGSNLLAIELVVQAGPRSLYGLLGAQVIPKEESEFVVSIWISNADGPRFDSSISPKFEDVRIGLPSQYAAAVIKGALQATNEIDSLPFAQLNFTYAAHSRVGSSNTIFEFLGRLVTELLLSKEDPASEQKLAQLLAMPINS